MSPVRAPARRLPWFWILVRVLVLSFLLALLSFAVCLLLGILGLSLAAFVRGIHPNLALAYREIALPAAGVAGAIALLAAVALEFRHQGGQSPHAR
jgi:hypothetical protein